MIQSLIYLQEFAVQQEKSENQSALHFIHEQFKVLKIHVTNVKARNVEPRRTHFFHPGSRRTYNVSVNDHETYFPQGRSKSMRKESERVDEVGDEATSYSKHI